MYDIARYNQADMLREAARARLAHEASMASDRPRRRFRFRLRRRSAAAVLGRPALDR
jgi:hypothetical protein